MKKVLVRIIAFLLLIAVVLVALLLLVGLPQFNFTNDRFTDRDYSNILGDSIKGNPRVVDIAMLGAHDAFSDRISKRSQVDPQEGEGSILNNRAVSFVGSGIFVRMARAQKSSAYELLCRGVRYFDVRITRLDGEWVTTHGLVSGPLADSVLDVLRFLSETQKEMILFDIQHIYTGEADISDFLRDLDEIRYEGRSLLDYVRFDPVSQPLSELRYSDVTDGGSGIVMLLKAEQKDGAKFYSYEESIRSVWHDKNDKESMLEGIGAEYQTLTENPNLDRDKFRVNQVQMTGKYDSGSIFRTITGWSQLDMAENFNETLLEQESFPDWFTVLPIFMTDYADSMEGDFNDRVVLAINAFNETL